MSSRNEGAAFCSQLKRCENFYGVLETPCRFAGDNDIAGLGIIVAFLVAAWLAFAVVVYTYFFVDNGIGGHRVNQLDQYLIQVVRRGVSWLARCAGKTDNLNPDGHEYLRAMHLRRTVIKRTLLSLSDQQLVTGIAVLSVGFSQTTTLTEYHFTLLTAFAWLSFTVYQCAAVVIESIFHMSSFLAIWRAIWIILMLCLLFVSELVISNDYWLASFGAPMMCVWDNIIGNYTRQLSVLVILTIFGIIWGGLDIIYGFFPSRKLTVLMKPLELLGVASLLLAAVPILAYQRLVELEQEPSSSIRRFAYRFCRITCYPLAVLMAVAVQLMTSRMMDLLRVWSLSLFYSSYIFVIRSLAPDLGLSNSEDSWAFGQAVAVFMLLLPFFGIIEAYLEEKSDDLGGLAGAERPREQAIAMQVLPPADGTNINAPASAFLAQTRTLGATATSNNRRLRANTKHPDYTKPRQDGVDSGDEYTLIEPTTGSSNCWALHGDGDLESRAPALNTQPTSSSRLREWRAKWPVIKMLADFERDHYQNDWFGPLLVVIIALIFVLTTVLGLLLLFVARF